MTTDRAEERHDGRAVRYNFIALEQCQSEKVRGLYDYWNRLRGAREMPSRRELDPTQIWSLLKNVFLTEWHREPDRLFYRIAGTELVAAFGSEISGKWLTELYADPFQVTRTLGLYRMVMETRKPLLGRTEASQLRFGSEAFDWVICPLSEAGDAVTHFIGLEDYVASRPYLGGTD